MIATRQLIWLVVLTIVLAAAAAAAPVQVGVFSDAEHAQDRCA